MNKATGLFIAALLGTALASCTMSSVPSPGALGSASMDRQPQGVVNVKPAHRIRPAWGWPQGIFVSDFGNNDVMGFIHCAGPNSLICLAPPPFSFNNGIGRPLGVWSTGGALYVANETANTVTRYLQNNVIPNFTFSNGVSNPQDVTGDHLPHYIYVTNYGVANTGYVNQYPRNQNVVKYHCVLNAYIGPFGVAVDAHHDVFVSSETYNSGQITEYVHGLQGCNATVLPLTFAYVQGIALDANGNLLVADAGANTIYTVPPPYTTPSVFASGFSARYVHVNRNNTQVLATDFSDHVYLLSYPGGATLQMLGSADGLNQAAAAVDWKNFVP